MADDEGSRRMDLNLYLGLPRRHRAGTESDLGSDLALGSLPLSEEMSSSNNTQSYPQNHIPQQQQHDADYTSYLQTRMQEEEQEEQEEENIEVGDDNNHGIQDSTEAMVLEGSSSNNHGGEYVPYSVSYAPTAPSESLLSPDNELLEVQEENNNAHVPYFPVSPTSTNQVNNTDNIGGGLGGGPVTRSYRGVDDGSLQRDLLQYPEFRFRRLIEANRRLRVRRYRSRVPYGVESDSSAAFSSAAAAVQAVRSGGGTIVSEGLNEMDGVSPKDGGEGVAVEDIGQDGKEQGNGMANFDCNVCLDVAKEPVVTSCGHLFCWPCLYQWLHIHCDHRECPVCKGEVTEADITPIYGRGNSEKESGRGGKEVDSSLKIPPRPRGRRSEGLRQRISRPLLRRPREDLGSWRFVVDDELINQPDELEEPPMLGTFEGASNRRMLTRLMAAQRFQREDQYIENMVNFGGNGSSSSATEVANSERLLDRIQGIGTHPILARRGIDFWRRFAFNSLLSTERLTAIAADLSTVVGGMETGASNSGASASTSANPPNSHPLNVQRPVEAVVAADQASASSTITVIQGDSSIPVDAAAEPSSVGSSRVLRRRRRNTVSLDIDGVNHACKRRRLN